MKNEINILKSLYERLSEETTTFSSCDLAIYHKALECVIDNLEEVDSNEKN